jgi:type VI secretion system Hcp family effector
MRTIKTLLISLFALIFLSVNGQEFTVKKQGLKFPDGRIQKNAFTSPFHPTPEFDELKIFAVTDPPIDGDIMVMDFMDHIQFYHIENKLTARYTDRVQDDPINNYFEAIKRADKASVPLMNTFHNGQPLQSIEFKMVYPGTPSGPTTFYTIKLDDVEILSVETNIITNDDNTGLEFLEKYKFLFKEMTLTYIDGGIETIITIYENDL